MSESQTQRDEPQPSSASIVAAATRQWFAPPRPHGHVIENRTVSFLELFYDLVFVVLVAEVAHTLATHVTWSGFVDFFAVFGLIWTTWLNGSMYQDLHGGDDGRSRSYIFTQMLLLVLLAVFSAHATTEDGVPFAVVYILLTLFIAAQWWRVRSVDTDPTDRRIVTAYVLRLILLAAVIGGSSFLGPEIRTWVWVGAVLIWNSSTLLDFRRVQRRSNREVSFGTESMSERFGLLTILVLGEVVVGVVNGLIEAERTPIAIVTGLLALGIGFGFWWNYFDAVGRRLPRPERSEWWVFAQLPLQASIAAAGAGMISLVEHAGDAHTPAPTAWLLAGASASVLAFMAVLISTIDYTDPARAAMRTPMRWAYLIGALASLAIGWWAPTPWLLAAALAAIHSVIWGYRFVLRALKIAQLGVPDTGMQVI